jgi:hypothetical protein
VAHQPPPSDKDPARTANEPPLATGTIEPPLPTNILEPPLATGIIEPPPPTNIQSGIINPPLPTNLILERLRPVLAELQAAAARAPRDTRIASAVAHLSATIAALESPAAEPEAPTP